MTISCRLPLTKRRGPRWKRLGSRRPEFAPPVMGPAVDSCAGQAMEAVTAAPSLASALYEGNDGLPRRSSLANGTTPGGRPVRQPPLADAGLLRSLTQKSIDGMEGDR